MMPAVLHPIEVLFGGGVALACAPNGELHAEELHGLFAGDTRVLSTYRLTIGGHSFRLLSRSQLGPSTVQWHMQNPSLRVGTEEIEEGTIHARLVRRVCGALHDDISICAYARTPLIVRLSLQIDADFADLFEVKDRSTPPRLGVARIARSDGVSLAYERNDFQRGLHVSITPRSFAQTVVGSQILLDVTLEPRREIKLCVHAVPEVDGRRVEFVGDPHAVDDDSSPSRDRVRIRADARLSECFEQGITDLERLAMPSTNGAPYIAAGAPWFLALFGRDTLVTALMTGLAGSSAALGALEALGRLQAHTRDDFRDAEPGKLPHELRHGELARFGTVPHSPYYGTHDAPALYVLTLWNAFRFTGDRSLLSRHLTRARAAMKWCETDGDPDGDGLLEYQTHSPQGYENQGWKDAGDAVPYPNGERVRPPIATVELQGYLYAARLAFAELIEKTGESGEAARQRRAASELRVRVEQRYWLEAEGTYALALDPKKRVVESIASNAGHLLWCGLPSPERARRVARRLLESDLFSGYGVRTLSEQHVSYNPLSYQRGSVWPHDCALIAAGFLRYGLFDEAARLFGGLLEAASAFERRRLPELFCGFARNDSPPVPYEKANTPQAWAAAVPVLAAQSFLRLVPDAPNGTVHLSPWLPEWLPSLEIEGVEIGDGRLEVSLRRDANGTQIVHARHPSLNVVRGLPQAPLWGAVS